MKLFSDESADVRGCWPEKATAKCDKSDRFVPPAGVQWPGGFDLSAFIRAMGVEVEYETCICNEDLCNGEFSIIVSAYRYIATATLAIIAVFVEYLGQFIDFNQIYRHSSVPKNTSPCIFSAFYSCFGARRRRDFFCHFLRVMV